MADMTVNLDKELSTFKERIKSDGSVRITRVGGAEGGGGAAHPSLLALLVLLLPLARRRMR
jgi:rhombotail lipoprotein